MSAVSRKVRAIHKAILESSLIKLTMKHLHHREASILACIKRIHYRQETGSSVRVRDISRQCLWSDLL